MCFCTVCDKFYIYAYDSNISHGSGLKFSYFNVLSDYINNLDILLIELNGSI